MNKFAAITALLLVSGVASAAVSAVFQAPEIDPASTLSALTLLAGGLTVLRGRFSKK